MGVVYIGDRFAGKTYLAMELANPQNDCVKVSSPDYEYLRILLFNEESGHTQPTDAQKERYLDIQVRLPTGFRQVIVDWVDTPGEIWRKTWRSDNPEEWNKFIEASRKSEGILLIVPLYREILKPGVDSEEFMT